MALTNDLVMVSTALIADDVLVRFIAMGMEKLWNRPAKGIVATIQRILFPDIRKQFRG